MPTYEYQCTTCNKQFEHVQRMSEDALSQCLCERKGDVHRIITTTNFSLKGSGWYVTDFRGGGSTNSTNNTNNTKSTNNADETKPASPTASESSASPPSATTPTPTTPA